MLPLKILKDEEISCSDVISHVLRRKIQGVVLKVQENTNLILLFGDNLVDFTDFSKTSESDRDKQLEELQKNSVKNSSSSKSNVRIMGISCIRW